MLCWAHTIWPYIVDHETVLILLLTAIVKVMPVPGSKFNLLTMYTWFYDAVHQFANLKNDRPTLPAAMPGK